MAGDIPHHLLLKEVVPLIDWLMAAHKLLFGAILVTCAFRAIMTWRVSGVIAASHNFCFSLRWCDPKTAKSAEQLRKALFASMKILSTTKIVVAALIFPANANTAKI